MPSTRRILPLDTPTHRGDVASLALGAATGTLNVALVLELYGRYGYPAPEGVSLALFAATLFAFGFVPGFVSGYTRLLVPILGFLALLAGVAYAEVTTPAPEWGELGGYTVVHGDLYVSRWANRLSAWVALLLAGGVAEFGLRAGYGIADRRLRHVPSLPVSRYVVAWIAGGFGSLFGATVTVHAVRQGANPPGIEYVIFIFATLVVAVPLAALLYRGLLLPTVLFVLAVPRPLVTEIFGTTDSPVFLVLLGPIAIALAAAGVLEYAVRYRFLGTAIENRFDEGSGSE